MAQQPPVILITGGAQGIGKGITAHFLNKGWRVVILDQNADAISACRQDFGAPDNLLLITMDVSREPDVASAVEEAARWGQGLDALVNNAGIGGQGLAIEDIDEATFDAMVAVNMKASFFATQAVVPGMKERRDGKIINISSNFAMGGAPFASHYAACKSALSGFVKSWARELAPWNIAVNAVAPGIIETGMTLGSIGKERIEGLVSEIPMGRIGTLDDISWAVAWLASGEADYMTGQVISPNGGATIVGI